MDPNDFTTEKPGQLVKNLDGHWTFVPDPLPGRVFWTDKLVSIVSEAEAALGRLSGLGDKFPRPERLVRLFLRREAELSSRIENTYAGVRTQLLFDVMPALEEHTPDVKEVDNNFRSLEFGLRSIRERDISQHLIRQMHQILLEGVRGQDMTPGQYRRIQAHIGRSTNINEARFVPPPPHLVPQCMDALELFMREDQNTPRIARLAMTHYQFECIHPFSDGNGRIGRVLILLLMCHSGMLSLPLFNPSAYLENHRKAYYDQLLELSQKGSWNQWIEFFCRGIAEECSNTCKRIETLEKLRKSYQEKVRTARAPANLPKLVDELFGQPRVTLEEVQKILRVWPTSAQRYIDKLVSLKILREVTGGQRNRVYLAQKIVEVFSTET